MKAERFSPDVAELLRILDRHRVSYLLVGGYAVFFHGYPRLTADVDLAYDPAPENARRLYEALAEFWGGQIPSIDSPDELTEVGMVFQFGRPPNRVDLLSRVDGITFDVAWGRRAETVLEGEGWTCPLPILSLVDLRKAKRAAGRPKDLDDLEHLPVPAEES